MICSPQARPHPANPIIAAWRSRSLAFAILLLPCACAPDHPDNGPASNVQQRSSTQSAEAAKQSTPMDGPQAQMLVDLKRMFDCEDGPLEQDLCIPRKRRNESIVVYRGDRPGIERGVDRVITGITVQALDRKGVPQDVQPAQNIFRLLRYLFPWWKESDAWLRQAIEIGRGKGGVAYGCASALHWRDYYIIATTGKSYRDGSANLLLNVSRYHPSRQTELAFNDPKYCPTGDKIIKLGN